MDGLVGCMKQHAASTKRDERHAGTARQQHIPRALGIIQRVEREAHQCCGFGFIGNDEVAETIDFRGKSFGRRWVENGRDTGIASYF